MIADIDISNYKYIVLIDESGNSAYDKTSDCKGNGAEDFLNLAAVCIKIEDIDKIKNEFSNIKNNLNNKKILHFNKINNHYDKLFCLKQISKLNFTGFIVISNKKTLKDSSDNFLYNPQTISGFYHKNLSYLFERINDFIYDQNINPNEVLYIIENSKAFILDKFKTYLSTIRDDKHKSSKWKNYLSKIDIKNIYAKGKFDTDLLFLADVLASSVRHITFGQFYDNEQIIETKYLDILFSHLYERNGKKLNNGIKFVHKLSDLYLSEDAIKFFENKI